MNKRVFIIPSFLVLSAIIFLSILRLKPRSPTNTVPVIITSLPIQFPYPDVSLDGLFSDNRKDLSLLDKDKTITITATGDIIPARSVNYQTILRKDFLWAFRNTSDLLKNSDITLINLESPLTINCPITQTGMNFCGDPRHIEGILYAGTDIANIANNHVGNKGADGINETVTLLKNNNIQISGDGNILYRQIKNTKFSFLGYNDIEKTGNPSPADDGIIEKQIKEADTNSDLVIVSFSWGDEYTPQPNNRQIQLAHLAVDSGADLIIGNHPHWIQPVEIYKGKLIVYAHGNFIFDQMWSEKTKEGIIGQYFFNNGKLIDAKFTPVKIRNYGEAYFPEGKESERILKEMKEESLKLVVGSKY